MTADQINTTYRSFKFRKTVSTFKNKELPKCPMWGKKKKSGHSGRLFGSNSFTYMLPVTQFSEILFAPCRDEGGSSKMLHNNLGGV